MATIPQIRSRLLDQFPEPQADLLAHVFVESYDALVTKAELNELTGVVKELAEAQKVLAQAQARTEIRVEELADAQKRTEFAVTDLAKQVGGLANALGGSLEDFACDLVPELLEKHWRMIVTSAQPEQVSSARKPREIDVVVRGTIDGRPVVVLCEVKSAVSETEVRRFLEVVRKIREERPDEDIRALFFGYKANRKAREVIVNSGAAMVFTRGVMIP